jgi:hypothetical protein
VRKSLADPEPFRLRYRQQLHELVANIVRSKQLEILQMIKQYTDENVPGDDRAAFVELVQDEIKRLHPGIIARYRLRQSEFTAWQKARKLRKNN